MATKTKKAPKTNETPVVEAAPVVQKDPVIERLDRIISLLEAPLTTKPKGLDLTENPWWSRFLSK